MYLFENTDTFVNVHRIILFIILPNVICRKCQMLREIETKSMRTHVKCNKWDKKFFPQYVEIIFIYQVSLGPFYLQCELFTIRQKFQDIFDRYSSLSIINSKIRQTKTHSILSIINSKIRHPKTHATKIELSLIFKSK